MDASFLSGSSSTHEKYNGKADFSSLSQAEP
jgi:hypothetical protein